MRNRSRTSIFAGAEQAMTQQCYFDSIFQCVMVICVPNSGMNSKISLNPSPTKTMHLKKSRFTEILIEENALDQSGFESWIFCHGMLFNSPDKWWGDYGRRDYPHESVDLCLYRDRSGRICCIDEKTRKSVPILEKRLIGFVYGS